MQVLAWNSLRHLPERWDSLEIRMLAPPRETVVVAKLVFRSRVDDRRKTDEAKTVHRRADHIDVEAA